MNVLAEPIHTWTLSKDSLLLRFYFWLYEDAVPAKVTFCKLFWAVITAPVVVVIFGLFTGTQKLMDVLPKRTKTSPSETERVARATKRASKGKTKAVRFVELIAAMADRVSAFFQRHIWIGKVSTKSLLGLLYLALGTIAAIPAGAYIWSWIEHTTGTLQGTGIGIGAILTIGLMVVLVWWLDTSGLAVRVGHKIKNGVILTLDFLTDGYHAVKYRTCPRVEIKQ